MSCSNKAQGPRDLSVSVDCCCRPNIAHPEYQPHTAVVLIHVCVCMYFVPLFCFVSRGRHSSPTSGSTKLNGGISSLGGLTSALVKLTSGSD